MNFDRELSLKRTLTDSALKSILDDDKTMQEALNGNTTAAARVWSTIADGTASVGRVLVWTSKVAERVDRDVLKVDATQPGEKARAALMAIGIRGRVDKHVAIRELFDVLDGFDNLENPDEEESHNVWVRICRSHGLLDGLDDAQAYTLIRDIRQGRR